MDNHPNHVGHIDFAYLTEPKEQEGYPGHPMSLCFRTDRSTHGDLVCTRHYPSQDEHCEPSYITIEQADPTILVNDSWLDDIAWNNAVGMQVKARADTPHARPPMGQSFNWTGWFLTVQGRNRTVIYRITGYNPQHHAWEASWPD